MISFSLLSPPCWLLFRSSLLDGWMELCLGLGLLQTRCLLTSIATNHVATGLLVTVWNIYPSLIGCWPYGVLLCQIQVSYRRNSSFRRCKAPLIGSLLFCIFASAQVVTLSPLSCATAVNCTSSLLIDDGKHRCGRYVVDVRQKEERDFGSVLH